MSPEGIDPQEEVYGDTYKPRKRKPHSCNAEIIAELERHAPDWVSINEDGTINPRVVYDRVEELKAKETQL